jgi:hypothetical protein
MAARTPVGKTLDAFNVTTDSLPLVLGNCTPVQNPRDVMILAVYVDFVDQDSIDVKHTARMKVLSFV